MVNIKYCIQFWSELSMMQMLAGVPTVPEAATRFLQFVNASPTPFHAVHNAALRLENAGFRKV
jgi:aspartyl aminopeptidase